jgi:hypothetical protein
LNSILGFAVAFILVQEYAKNSYSLKVVLLKIVKYSLENIKQAKESHLRKVLRIGEKEGKIGT